MTTTAQDREGRVKALLECIAAKIERCQERGLQMDDATPEAAFLSAMFAVSNAIREALHEEARIQPESPNEAL